MKTVIPLMIVALLPGLAAETALAAGPIDGLWLTADGSAAIEFGPCGRALCGRIAWLQSPLDEMGLPLKDTSNSDPSKRQRPVCGLEIASGLIPHDANSWDDGILYDPDEGKTYTGAVELTSPTTISVTGYFGVKLLGRSEIWTKVTDHAARCDSASPGPATPSVPAPKR